MLIGQAVAAVNANAPVDACPAGPGDDVISIGVPGEIRAVIAGNISPLNDGVQHGGVQTNGPVDVSVVNSVVAGNSGDQCGFGSEATTSANRGNASSDNSCGFGLEDITAGLGVLADNDGGPTPPPEQGFDRAPWAPRRPRL